MKRKRALLFVVPLLVILPGCEACNGGIGNKASVIAKPILKYADETCRDRGGTANIMLMTDREDDGIVTCKDGTNHYFDV